MQQGNITELNRFDMGIRKDHTVIIRLISLFILSVFNFGNVHADEIFTENPDSISMTKQISALTERDTVFHDDSRRFHYRENPYRFRPLGLAIPATLIGVGIIGLESDWLKGHNHEIREELQEHPHSRITIDDFTQFAPLVATYGLKLFGVRSLHGYGDMTIIAGTAYLLTGLSVYGLKSLTKIERPDGSSRNSFPSGHTATAFAGAELLRKEYWDVSPLIGIAGYVVAAGTGFFRMYNNRHWLTDVISGAGIGILSAQAAYWLYPIISRHIFHRQYLKNIYLTPQISPHEKSLSCIITF